MEVCSHVPIYQDKPVSFPVTRSIIWLDQQPGDAAAMERGLEHRLSAMVGKRRYIFFLLNVWARKYLHACFLYSFARFETKEDTYSNELSLSSDRKSFYGQAGRQRGRQVGGKWLSQSQYIRLQFYFSNLYLLTTIKQVWQYFVISSQKSSLISVTAMDKEMTMETLIRPG